MKGKLIDTVTIYGQHDWDDPILQPDAILPGQEERYRLDIPEQELIYKFTAVLIMDIMRGKGETRRRRIKSIKHWINNPTTGDLTFEMWCAGVGRDVDYAREKLLKFIATVEDRLTVDGHYFSINESAVRECLYCGLREGEPTKTKRCSLTKGSKRRILSMAGELLA